MYFDVKREDYWNRTKNKRENKNGKKNFFEKNKFHPRCLITYE